MRFCHTAELEALLGHDRLGEIDLFDQIQLAGVIRVCRQSRSISEAGRALFSLSRERKKTANDADRLRKYLARFGLNWNGVRTIPLTGTAPSWTVGEPIALTISAGLDAPSRPGWFIPADQLPPLPTPTPVASPGASAAPSP